MYLGSPRSGLPEHSLLLMLGITQYREITPTQPIACQSFI